MGAHYCTVRSTRSARSSSLLDSATGTQGVEGKITRPRRSSNRRGYVVVWLRRSGAGEVACLRQIDDTLHTANPRRPLACASTCHQSARTSPYVRLILPLTPWTGISLPRHSQHDLQSLDGDGLLSVLTSQPALRPSSLVSRRSSLVSLPSPRSAQSISLPHLSFRPHAQPL